MMIKLYTIACFISLIAVCCCTTAYGQTDTTKAPPQPIPHNAGFDVIVKTNGAIVYGLVTEVAPYLIFYKRTDIPDGPIYSIPRNEVYAISYRNQVVDYIQPFAEEPAPMPGAANPINRNTPQYPRINYNKNFLENGTLHLGLGFIRGFSKVDNADSYSSSGGFPMILIGYDASLNTNTYDRNKPTDVNTVSNKNNLKVGVLIGFGSHKFSNEDYSTYDSTINSLSLKENVFGIYVYGKYSVLNTTSRFQPYITFGVGVATSHITSENRISFINDETKVLLVKSGARGASLNLMARAGAAYYISNQLQAFADAGSGLSIINLGVSVSVK